MSNTFGQGPFNRGKNDGSNVLVVLQPGQVAHFEGEDGFLRCKSVLTDGTTEVNFLVTESGEKIHCFEGILPPPPVPPPGSLSEFAYFWQSVSEVTGTIAANNGKALFENSSSNNTAGITTVAGSGDITIGADAGGIYDINWQVAGAEPNAFAVFINGVKAAGSVNGSGAGTQQNNGFTLLTLLAGDVVSLRSDNAPAAITLQLAGTTDTDQIVTSIMFKRLSA